MAVRAVWKGFLKFGSVSCAIKLVGATSESEKISFRILNRKDKLPVKSAYLDESTGKIVAAEDQIKGYALDNGDFLLLEPEEIKKLKLASDHTLEVDEFIDAATIDQRYLDKPYYVIPGDAAAAEGFAAIRDAMKKKNVAARSCIVLYQRGREVVLQPSGKGMLMTTLRKHNEMIAEDSIFGSLKTVKIDPDMIEIATLLIDKKVGKFEPSRFEDTYENALIEMINAKKAGKKPPKPVAAPKENVINLAEVLRKSLAKEGLSQKGAKASKSAPERKTRKSA